MTLLVEPLQVFFAAVVVCGDLNGFLHQMSNVIPLVFATVGGYWP